MPRKTQHAGVLAVDPSWKGMGIVAFVPVHDYEFACCLDIRSGIKRYDLPQNTINLVCGAIRDLFDENPQLFCCDRIVIENQFKTKMRNLQYIVSACLKAMLMTRRRNVTIEHVSIMKLKKHFSLECTGSHYQNKKMAVEYVTSNERALLIGHLHDKNDNICDAILLLNYSVQTNKLEFMSYGNCSICDNPLEVKVSQSAANPGREFVTCPNGRGAKDGQPANKCNNSFNWIGADGKLETKKPFAGAKRAPVPVAAPPAKKMVPADLTSFKHDLQMFEQKMRELAETGDEQVALLKATMDSQFEALVNRIEVLERMTLHNSGE